MTRHPLLRLLSFGREYKRYFAGLVVVMVLATAASVAEPLIVKYAIDSGLVDKNLGVIYAAVGLYVFVTLASWGLEYAQIRGMGWIGQHIILNLRNALFRHLQSLSLRYYSEQRAGWIISRMTSDIENFSNLLNEGAQNLLKNGLTLIGVLIAIFVLDWRLAAVVTLTVLPLMVVSTHFYRKESRKVFRRTRETIAEVAAQVQESVSGMRVVQAFTAGGRSAAAFDDRNEKNRLINLRSTMLSSLYFPGVELFGALGIGVVLLYGGYLVVNGGMTVGTLVAFIGLINMFFQPIQQLSQLYSDLQSTLASLEKVFSVMDTETDAADSPQAKEVRDLRGEVKFEDVSFSYGERDYVLDGVSFRIGAGETLAIVGETGAGKSTLVKLLSRLHDPTEGRILIDGEDLRNVRGSSLRSHMGVVLQDTFLFTGNIRENIRYGRPDATDGEIEPAARMVGAEEFILRLPDGYETQVRERGGRISVGERQLVAFARALLADPRILVLDEATSSVDLATERRIERAMESLLEGRTSVVIAHRLSTVRGADRILVIEGGRVVEQGTHEELMSQPSSYSRLYSSQFVA